MRHAATANDVTEALRRGGLRHRRAELARLDTALRHGHGHIVVTGESQPETEAFVDEALRAFDDRPIEHVYARRTSREIPSERAVVVVHDAELASVDELESFRMRIEQACDGPDGVRVILLGTPALERTLAQTAARALASRVGAVIRLSSRKTARARAAVRRRRRVPKPLFASALTAAAAVVCALYTDLPAEKDTAQLVEAASSYAGPLLAEAKALLADAVSVVMGDADAPPAVVASAAPGARAAATAGRAGIERTGYERATSPPRHDPTGELRRRGPGRDFSRTASPGGTDVDRDALRPHIAGGGAGYSTLGAGSSPTAAAHRPGAAGPRSAPFYTVVRSGSWSTRTGAPAGHGTAYAARTAPRRFPLGSGLGLTADERRRGPARDGEGAVLETLLMSKELGRSDTYTRRSPSIHAGAYDDANDAFALKSVLAAMFDLLAVARTDPAEEPVYGVRVFELDTDEELENVGRLMTGDDVPVRLVK